MAGSKVRLTTKLTEWEKDMIATYGGIVASRYWNTNNMQISIIAIIGGNQDVAAYIGATQGARREAATQDWTRQHGAKLYREEAFRMLPSLEGILEELQLHYRD